MRKILFAVLLAISALPVQAQAWQYAPDYSNPTIWDPSLWSPKLVTASYAMVPSDRVLIANCVSGCAITLPSCVAGIVAKVVNASPALLSGGTTANVLTASPAGADVFQAGAAPLGSTGAFPYTLRTGTTTFRAVGAAGGCSWAWD